MNCKDDITININNVELTEPYGQFELIEFDELEIECIRGQHGNDKDKS